MEAAGLDVDNDAAVDGANGVPFPVSVEDQNERDAVTVGLGVVLN